jgi:tetratricopeptide (TPR) repeat protein
MKTASVHNLSFVITIALVLCSPATSAAANPPASDESESAAPAGEQPEAGPAAPERPDSPPDQPEQEHGGNLADQKEKARTHYVAGNEFLRSASFEQAVAEYHRSLQYWKHPRIYYNLGIALMNLDRPVDAYDALSEALASAEGLGALHEQAVNYQRLLGGQIGKIEVTCEEADTRVTLNGNVLFHGPGTHRSRVRVGSYQLVASKIGFLPAEGSLTVLPDRHVSAEISMLERDDAVIKERLIERTWVPWAVVGFGSATLLAAGAMHWQSFSLYSDADSQFAMQCSQGCRDQDPEAQLPVGRMNNAGLLQNVAIGAYVIGASALVTGLTLAYLNQPKVTRIEHSDIRTRLVPVVSGNMVGLQGTWTY